MKRLLAPLSLLVLVAACDFTYAEPEGPGVVAGIDLDALFAAPTAGEVAAIRTDWAGRTVEVSGYQLEATDQVQLARRDVRVEIVSHLVTGQRHYGAIVVPDGAAPGSLPVLMYLHGGDGGVSTGEIGFVMELLGDIRDDFVVVAPSFRDEELRHGGRSWRSEGPASPWNYDVDDAMALLSVTLETVPEANGANVGVFGFSRGAGVALLMGARDARVDRIAEFFGPTDFFGPFVQEVAIEALNGAPRNLPGVDFMNENYLIPLREGTLSTQDLRPELVRRSAVLFVDDIPLTQAHHGTADTVVPVSQAHSLIDAMEAAGKQAPTFEGFIYEGGEHNPITLIGGMERATEFLRPLTQAG